MTLQLTDHDTLAGQTQTFWLGGSRFGTLHYASEGFLIRKSNERCLETFFALN